MPVQLSGDSISIGAVVRDDGECVALRAAFDFVVPLADHTGRADDQGRRRGFDRGVLR